jgi:hypothetical protein
MGQPVRLDGIHQGLRNLFLADDILKNLRTPFPGQNFISHMKP